MSSEAVASTRDGNEDARRASQPPLPAVPGGLPVALAARRGSSAEERRRATSATRATRRRQAEGEGEGGAVAGGGGRSREQPPLWSGPTP